MWTPPPRNRPKPRWIPGSGAADRPGSGPISRLAFDIFNEGEIYRVIDEAHLNAEIDVVDEATLRVEEREGARAPGGES